MNLLSNSCQQTGKKSENGKSIHQEHPHLRCKKAHNTTPRGCVITQSIKWNWYFWFLDGDCEWVTNIIKEKNADRSQFRQPLRNSTDTRNGRPQTGAGAYRRLAAWRSGNGVGRINEVTLRRARLVMGWVKCPGSTPGGGTLFQYVTSQPRPTQPFILSGSISWVVSNFIGECSRG